MTINEIVSPGCISPVLKKKKFAFNNFLIWVCVVIIIFSSCEKVVNIDLNNSSKKYIIQGIVNNQGICQVKISQTVNFSAANNFPAISGATVTIKDNNGVPVLLNETSAGLYETNLISGAPTHTYNLAVNISGQQFIATSQMPVQVRFDSLYISELSLFGSTIKFATVAFHDPPLVKNAYHFIQYKNSLANKGIFALNDDFSDGKAINSQLNDFNGNDDKINNGDTIKVEMQCIDANVYLFWTSLAESSTGNSQNASPGNPVSNINGGALGFFSAHTSQNKTVIVR